MHLRYVQQSGKTFDAAKSYLTSRHDDLASKIQKKSKVLRQLSTSPGSEQPEAQERAEDPYVAADEASSAPSQLIVDDYDQRSSVSHQQIRVRRLLPIGSGGANQTRTDNVPWPSGNPDNKRGFIQR